MGRYRKARPVGLAAFANKPIVGWKDISAATGLAVGTLKQYKKLGKMPQPDGEHGNAWLASRKDLRTWVQQEAQGAAIHFSHQEESDD